MNRQGVNNFLTDLPRKADGESVSPSAAQPGPRYYAAFDVLRLLGAGLVTMQHVLTLLRKDHHTYIGIVNMGQLGVALFMGLSGFLAFQTRRPPAAWLGHRLVRIYPAYWIAIIGSFLLAGLIEHKQFGAAQVISQLLGTGVFTHPDNLINSPTWFISMLLVCYLGAFLIFVIAGAPSRKGGASPDASPPGSPPASPPASPDASPIGDDAPASAKLAGTIALLIALALAVFLIVFPKMAAAPHALTFAVAFALAALLPGRIGLALLVAGLLFLLLSPWRAGFIYPALTLPAIAAALYLPAPPRLVRTLAAFAYEYYLVHGVALFGVIHFLRPWPLIAAPLGVLLACIAAAALRWLVGRLLPLVGIHAARPAAAAVVRA